MTGAKASTAVLALVLALGPAAPAVAQQVLVCQTLHNDLTNFDRRAQTVDRYAQEIDELRHQGEANANTAGLWCVVRSLLLTQCEDRTLVVKAEQAKINRMVDTRLLSKLGGADPVRVALVNEMRRNGCLPPPGYREDGSFFPQVPVKTPAIRMRDALKVSG